MSRKQYTPYGSSHEKKLSRKERKKIAKENPIISNPEEPVFVSAPSEEDKKQIRTLTLLAVGGLLLLLALMYYIFVSK